MISLSDYSGQTDIFDPRKFTWPIHIIGCGGIGSNLILPLAKMGIPELHLWDPDQVEDHNIPSQLYRPSDIGANKVDIAKQILESFEVDATITTHTEAVCANTQLEGVVISGVDSMTARQAIWEAVKANFTAIPLLMDGRIGGEQLELITLSPSDFDAVNAYESGDLFADEDALPLPCAARTTVHTPLVLDGLILANLTLFARGLPTQPRTIIQLKTMQFISLTN